MAEPTTLEDAYEGYKANRFSRKDLFGFIIDRLKAAEAEVDALKGKVREMVEAREAALAAVLHPGYMTDALAADSASTSPRSRSEKMKDAWAKRKAAQAIADGVGEAVNG